MQVCYKMSRIIFLLLNVLLDILYSLLCYISLRIKQITQNCIKLLAKILFFCYYRLNFRMRYLFKEYTPSIGLHTVFIAKENILFLEEWIRYHKNLGVEYFFLHDNSQIEVMKSSHAITGAVVGKIAKRNVPYDDLVAMSNDDIEQELLRIQTIIPNVYILPWSPRDQNGNVCYGKFLAQSTVQRDYKHLVDWIGFIDIDEYIVSHCDIIDLCRKIVKQGYGGLLFNEYHMDNRYNHLDKPVHQINLACSLQHRYSDTKMLCYLPRTVKTYMHSFATRSIIKKMRSKYMYYRHYKCHTLPTTDLKIIPIHDTYNFQNSATIKSKLPYINPNWKQLMDQSRITVNEDPAHNFNWPDIYYSIKQHEMKAF